MLMKRSAWLAIAALTLAPGVPAAAALVGGILFALLLGNPWLERTRAWTTPLLQLSVVGLGFGMNLDQVLRAGAHGIGVTAAGISATLALGWALGRALRTERDVSLLVSSGTAICGGSAIAAVASAIDAPAAPTAVALATVFLLNAAALVLFPPIGHYFGLSQSQFGLWAALAIHDTSSVVGASMQYGREALELATTVKLARALWIVPLAFGVGWARGGARKKAKRPWFILGFVLAAAAASWIPGARVPGEWLAAGARHALVLTLFLIGSGLTPPTLRQVGARPLVQGLLLWLAVAGGSLWAIAVGAL
jgi:uncharacterized integral membrane protein (TIGR00698 family)